MYVEKILIEDTQHSDLVIRTILFLLLLCLSGRTQCENKQASNQTLINMET